MSDRFAALRRLNPAIVAALICTALLIVFWVRAQVAVRGKSSTYDEPMHALGAWVHWHQGDWRINYEDPPLWHYWAALPNSATALKVDFNSPRWKLMASVLEQQWIWSIEVLYATAGNDGEAFVQRSRSMMIVIGVALGGIIAWWGYRAGGVVAAVSAAILFSLDPNFLAHAALVKNDVAMALCTAGLCMSLWRMGLRLTPWNLAGAGGACAAAMATKFSGVLLAPAFVVMLLAVRALLPWPWQVWTRTANRWWHRIGVAVAAMFVIGLFSYAGVWVAYGLQFGGMPDPTIGIARMNTQSILDDARELETRAKLGNWTPAQAQDPEFARQINEQFARLIETWKPDRVLTSLKWMLDRRLFPEAWLNGLMFVRARSYARGSFLDGETSIVGFRSYFPKAMLYKTPLSTLIAFAAAGILLIVLFALGRREGASARVDQWRHLWLAACVLLPVLAYMLMSINSNLNIGFRHVLPLYPLLYLGVGCAVAAAGVRWKWSVVAVAAAVAVGLAIESIAIAPDYLTFFNAPAGGQRGGIHRLGDSNLDWGQDLPSLAEFVKRPENKDSPLYLSYFGMVDPRFYGLRYLNMPGGYEWNPQALAPTAGSIVAISATKLQGIYLPDWGLRAEYAKYLSTTPTAVLGGTIYIYDLRNSSPPK